MENFCHPFASIHIKPCCLESERAVLGSMLLDAGTRRQLRENLRVEDFYDLEHQHIFQRLCALADFIDLGTLKADRSLFPSADYADALLEQACLPEDVPHHARKLHKRSVLRRLIEAQAEIALDMQAS